LSDLGEKLNEALKDATAACRLRGEPF